ncbi:hypothetical protein AGOR_G00162680 [Albula goreensis]|uniref:Uveal autoantigen with coiled-coil domains and ankyrin repeats n=1 Tax=Albula goreensis TaxID=1534307 RepID=A0A8T3CVQ1_9TELE|nr:hypothetical protein AGOR_G00162680 [Albula goreensis]
MKSLKNRLKKQESTTTHTEWGKHDERLLKAVERGEVDKLTAALSKKGVVPTKLDLEGRSAFHLAASRGQLGCLNAILGHGVDVMATDGNGKNALHLAARNGHSACVEKLLQHKCPVEKVDLQGRSALHDAVMAGCSTSVQLLCDNGAAVNASDVDGRTPLVLATQMCHPQICHLLLERGADITAHDKHNKTALILGCEFGCEEAVEVLLQGGADVTAVDNFGYDSYHYARLSKSPELLTLVKRALDRSSKAKHMARMRARKLSLDRNPEVADRAKATQKSPVEEPQKQEDSSTQPATKGKDRNTLVKQPVSLDSAQVLLPSPTRSITRPLSQGGVAGDGETELLRRELAWAEREVSRLQGVLQRKERELEEAQSSREEAQREADRQVRDLEDALGEVQRRMLESEQKVKQLQVSVEAMQKVRAPNPPRPRSHEQDEECDHTLHLEREAREARAALEEQNAGLQRQLEEAMAQARQMEEELRERMQELSHTLQTQHVPLQSHREAIGALQSTVERLGSERAESERRRGLAEEEAERMQVENCSLSERIRQLEAELQCHRERELGAAATKQAGLEAESRATQMEEEVREAKMELRGLKEVLERDYISLGEHQEVQGRLNSVAREAQEEVGRLSLELEAQKRELDLLQEAMCARFVPMATVEEKEACLEAARRELLEVQQVHGQQIKQLEQLYQGVTAQRDELQQRSSQREEKIQELQLCLKEALKQEHEREARSRGDGAALLAQREQLEKEVLHLQEALKEEQESGAQKAEDVASLRSELQRATEALGILQSRAEVQEAELAAEKQRLEEEAQGLKDSLAGLSQRCQEAQREVQSAQESEECAREEVRALRSRSESVHREVLELKERYGQSITTIQHLQDRIHTSSQHSHTKDQRITELMKEVERLKQALNGLSQLACADSAPTGSAPSKWSCSHPENLQDQVIRLQQQLEEAKRQHREVVSIYRTHLLSAAQGQMDAEVQAALLQIIRMRQEFVC